ncbi:MAG: 2,5-diamino-6-(ribosylamino)-4(3H)-pyrimidinone 5'-phosphate reductase [Promethearchaeota archaeon]
MKWFISIIKKPYIILSAAMTMDGKIASKSGDTEISDEIDWQEVHKLRIEVDAIMVGKNTILKDDPKLHIKYHESKGYYRIVVDSKLSIPPTSKVITFRPDLYPTIICTTQNIPKKLEKLFTSLNVKIIKAGKGNKVDLITLMPKLVDFGIKRILLEGGGTLNWSFLKHDLIDEIRLTISPWMVGGKDAISLVEGEGFSKMNECQRFILENCSTRNSYVTLRYRRERDE